MSAPKYTKGPWAIYRGTRNDVGLPQAQRKDNFIGVLADGSGLPIAEIHLGNIQANANLISASPELLESSQAVIHWLAEFVGLDAWHEIRGAAPGSIAVACISDLLAAIDKANGEGGDE